MSDPKSGRDRPNDPDMMHGPAPETAPGAPHVDRAPTVRMARMSKVTIQALIQAQQVSIHLQPIVHLATGGVFAYEGLCRCAVRELASPFQLLGAAVDQGAMGLLGRHLRHQAMRMVPGARMFINVHPAELDEEFLASEDDPIFTHDGEVVIEIPESAPLMQFRFAHSTLDTLRKRGIKIAIDDFGAGYSNIGYITALEPEVVKLDRELIAGVEPGSRQQRLLASLNALCIAQGACVVAEGIETETELAAVVEAGIPLAQGYLFGHPSPSGAMTWQPRLARP
ncbi:MAG TPA: EAL domain-containing protein [Kofleriaceae bacterium]|nr:EAL domain-containing protein [Kofleriaceae bacterium]